MKIVLVVFIMLAAGLMGYMYKSKFITQLNTLKELQNYLRFFNENLLLFKTNIEEININYIITQKNKTAKNNIITLNNQSKYQINQKYLQNAIFSKDLKLMIDKYFHSQGMSEYDQEIEKLKAFILVIENYINATSDELKNKGELYFKIMLALGAVVSILIW